MASGGGIEIKLELLPDRLVREVPQEMLANLLVYVVNGDGYANGGAVLALARCVFPLLKVLLDAVLTEYVIILELKNGRVLVRDSILQRREGFCVRV